MRYIEWGIPAGLKKESAVTEEHQYVVQWARYAVHKNLGKFGKYVERYWIRFTRGSDGEHIQYLAITAYVRGINGGTSHFTKWMPCSISQAGISLTEEEIVDALYTPLRRFIKSRQNL